MYSIDEKVKATIEPKNLAGSMFKGDVCSLGWSRNMFVLAMTEICMCMWL
jgi:hypothetical protein